MASANAGEVPDQPSHWLPWPERMAPIIIAESLPETVIMVFIKPSKFSFSPVMSGVCAADADCLAVGVTSDPCYSAGCSLPVAASTADAKADPCLVPWSGDSGPDVPADCRSNEPTPCTLACAVPPTCIDARCEAGMCMLSITQDGTDCKRDGDAP